MNDNNLIEKTLYENTFYHGRILNLHIDEIELPNGEHAYREYVSHRGGAAILPVDGDDIYLVRQFRYPYKEIITEIPAGKLEPGEEPSKTAERELEEETGTTGTIRPLGVIYPTPGYTNEKLYIFVATDLKKTHTHFDDDEFLDIVRVPLRSAVKNVLDGTIKDAKTAYAILKYAFLAGIGADLL